MLECEVEKAYDRNEALGWALLAALVGLVGGIFFSGFLTALTILSVNDPNHPPLEPDQLHWTSASYSCLLAIGMLLVRSAKWRAIVFAVLNAKWNDNWGPMIVVEPSRAWRWAVTLNMALGPPVAVAYVSALLKIPHGALLLILALLGGSMLAWVVRWWIGRSPSVAGLWRRTLLAAAMPVVVCIVLFNVVD